MDIKNKDIDSLIIANLTQKINGKEKKLLDQWLKESPGNRAQFNLIEKTWQERSLDRKFINASEALDKIWNEAHHTDYQQVKTFNTGLFMKIAAALLILFAATYLFLENTKKSIDSAVVESNLIIKGNPAGQKSKVTLSDGSIIWLNSASSISYLENFTSADRRITLEGEAFFEVAQDPSRPFVVTTGDISTTALGTSFNINALDPENIKIALITGKVKVLNQAHQDQPYLLNPGMGLVFSGNEEANGYNFDLEKVINWKNGVLVLDGEDFSEFKVIIERWYGITVTVEGKVPRDWSIKGQFENESLENVITTISFNKKFNYVLKGKDLTIKF